MVYFSDAAAYMEQSILLLQARPTTTRISTRYTLSPPQKPKASSSSGAGAGASESDAAATTPRARGILVLKTYDPVSGACLKYRTNKQAEIGRLVAGMGRCARVMARVPLQSEEEELKQQEAAAPTAGEQAKPTTTTQQQQQSGQQQQQQSGAAAGAGGGGGGKKKKKGKK